MEKLLVAGPKRLAREVLAELQRVGVVHLETLRPEELPEYRLTPEEERLSRRWEGVAASAEHILDLLGHQVQPRAPFEGSLEEAELLLQPWLQQAEALAQERISLEEELQAIELYAEPFRRFADLAGRLGEGPWLRALPLLIAPQELPAIEQALQEHLADRFLLEALPWNDRLALVIAVLKEDLERARSAISRLGLGELKLPGAYSALSPRAAFARMEERSRLAPEELQGIRKEIERLRAEAQAPLESLWTRARDEAARYRALGELAAGRYGFALMGWVPLKAKPKVEAALGRLKGQILYTFEPVEHEPSDKVPVTLENPPWARPFQLLHSFLNTPPYGGYDPTVMIATFFPFFFGMVVGDIGVALLFLLFARWLGGYVRRKETLVVDFLGARIGPSVLADIVRVLNWMWIWSLIWGLIYGEFFGTFLVRLHVFYVPGQGHGLIPVLIDRYNFAETSNLLILVCLAFGAYQVLYAFILKAYLALRHGQRAHFWEGLGYFSGLVGLIAFAYTFLSGKGAPLTYIILSAGLLFFLLAVVFTRAPLMIVELPTRGGHILSYIRIYAVGIAGAVLNKLCDDVGFGLAHRLGVPGALIGLVLGLLMLTVVLALTTLGHILQPIRLLWIEFATNLGFYDENGRPYRPFQSVRGDAA
jgi:V/A-type H+-transporting ATPase subunit I